MVRLSETFELLRVLVSGGVATAIVVQVGQYFRERRSGWNRLDEIEAERDRDVAKIEAASRARLHEIEAESDARLREIKANSDAEIRKLQVELALERERNRALTSGTLSIGPQS